jgi:eukaryotic-like serine/threonine-protein kinase
MVVVPFLLGESREAAESRLAELDLDVEVREQESAEPRGTVLETQPVASTRVEAGSTVVLVVSSGPVDVPDVVGLGEDEATNRLEDAGFRVNVEEDASTPAEPGEVLRQDPTGQAPEGATVTIVVSRYEEPEEPTEDPTPSEETPTDEDPGNGNGNGNGSEELPPGQQSAPGRESAPGLQE